MNTKKLFSHLVKTGTRLVILAVIIMAAFISSVMPAAAAPISFDLYAVSGTTTLPSQSVTVWGYNSTNAAVTLPGGPTLVVNQGDEVTIILHNQLSEDTALLFQGQDMIPDMTGIAAGGTKTYTFTASRPGTYLYEAGLLANAQHQVAMGLYGALIVNPAVAGQAYNDPTTAYNDQAVLVLGELDPALNNRANPATFDMRNYAPKYFLINGKVYPNTDPIPTAPGNNVLLRYVNAGMQAYSMSILGLRQVQIAMDGSPFAFGRTLVAETLAPGQTADMLVSIPAAAADGSKFALYDGNLMLHNNKTNNTTGGFGGMLTFLTVTGTPPAGDTTGPATSSVSLAPSSVNATVSDLDSGGSNVTAAEFFVDSTGANGSGIVMTGTFGTVSVDVSGVITPTLSGSHTVYVHGMDEYNNWGPFESAVINNDTTGPTTSALVLSPVASNGSVNVALSASADDTASGGSNIAAAEYTIDGGSAALMSVSPSGAQIASLTATISAATVNGLSEGSHTVSVRSQDSLGNWGTPATITLVVDKTGPATSSVSAAPNPNNGTLGFNSSTPAVRVTANFADTTTNVSTGEGFIDTVGANGTGFIFLPSDGLFNSLMETGYIDIPLTTINALSQGNHTIYVHGKDIAGNWGTTSSTILTIDKTAPTVNGVTASPNPTVGAASVTLSATGRDAGTRVTSAEWFTGADPGAGNGTPMTVSGTGPWSLSATINVSTWVNGSYTLNVRARDAAGNWSLLGSTVLVVSSPPPPLAGLYFSTLGNTAVPGVGGTPDDANIYNWNGTAYSLEFNALGAGLPAGANVDGYDRIDASHFYLSFSANNTNVPGLGNVQDEDVIYYNNGVWSVFFDGTAHGLTAGGQDLDAINIVSGILYFSTFGNNSVPGVAGTPDDADIYSWNGTSFALVWDATANGLPAAANVDGFVRVDATHFYMSFSAANTAVPGIGNVQDEDVVYNNNGTWSVFFDGTANGLGTSANLDIDAFDIP